MSCVPKHDTEFRRHLETRGADGESIVEHMARKGISLQTERECFEKIKDLQSRALAEPSSKRPHPAPEQSQRRPA